MINFRDNDILFLLGAGASADAGIPTSIKMISEIESLIKDDPAWKEYNDLYDYMKSALFYSRGIKGHFENSLNIEDLVNSLSEIEKKEEHIIYPFIGNWNMKLLEVGGTDFARVRSFKDLILAKLTKWVTKQDYRPAAYYSHLLSLQKELSARLHIFTLNYDLCLENNCKGIKLERGFDESTRQWDWRLFDESNPGGENVKIYLYKLHGSIDWMRTPTADITYSEDVTQVERPLLIFGTDYKLQYIDPYLFLMYQFRRRSLEAKVVVTIGYGFGDPHINAILAQALATRRDVKLYSVGIGIDNGRVTGTLRSQLPDKNFDDKVSLHVGPARNFFEENLQLATFANLFPEQREDDPF